MRFQAAVFFAVLFLSRVALAAAEAGGAEEGGLPQLRTELYPEQLFWLVLSFGALYALMAFVALPGVKATQDKRHSIIETELAAATAASEAAKAMVTQYEKALADARAKAQSTVSEISAQAAKESAVQQVAQQQELAKRLHEAESKIRASRDAAIKDIKGSAAELAQGIVEKVAGIKMQVG
jgi:F-type H+-transporting ATPase subunit b